MSKYIDIHCHLNLSPLLEDVEGVAARMREHDVAGFVIGTDFETSKLAVEIADKYENIWAGVGLHPADNVEESFDISKYEELARGKKVVCIGECGLDYFREKNDEIVAKQKEIFIKHIELAERTGKPLMIHARPSKGSMDAYEDVLDILEGKSVKANFHFFVGDLNIAKRALEMGFTMSFDGPITFARDYDEVIKFLPIESIMTETDAPFAAPVPYRGKTCEPYMVKEVVKKIAEIKGMDEGVAAKAIFDNAKRVFTL